MPSLPIKGFLPMTTMDYKGKVASVVFLQGCNFRCPFCQNPELVKAGEPGIMSEKEVLGYLKENKEWLDGVVITGGEPTLHKELPDFLVQLKTLGFAVKIQTNGTNPEMLEELIGKKLLDYISMDIKAPLQNYDALAGVIMGKQEIQKSIGIIRNSGIDYSFHTTVAPGLSLEDIKKIGEWLAGSKKYVLQQFRPEKTLDKSYAEKKPHTKEELQEMAEAVKGCFGDVEIEGN